MTPKNIMPITMPLLQWQIMQLPITRQKEHSATISIKLSAHPRYEESEDRVYLKCERVLLDCCIMLSTVTWALILMLKKRTIDCPLRL